MLRIWLLGVSTALLAALTVPAPVPAAVTTLDWGPCRERATTVAVSRIPATDPSAVPKVLVFNSGGPGLTTLWDSTNFVERRLADLNRDHTIVAFDPRGTSWSDRLDCDAGPYPELAPTATPRERARATWEFEAETNRRCVGLDPQFAAGLSPTSVARDLDLLRAALGVEKISYFGKSFGTIYGTVYRTLFDEQVDRMWLDSPVPAGLGLAAMDAGFEAFGDQNAEQFFAWLAARDTEFHLGAEAADVRAALLELRDRLDQTPRDAGGEILNGAWVVNRLIGGPGSWAGQADDLVVVRDGGDPVSVTGPPTAAPSRPAFGLDEPRSISLVQYSAVFCNVDPGPTDFDAMWTAAQARRQVYPVAGGSSFTAAFCADWPRADAPLPPLSGSSPLQVSGHRFEATTPYPWAQDLARAAGVPLLTIDDAAHGSLDAIECADRAVAFFRTGIPAEGSCPGLT